MCMCMCVRAHYKKVRGEQRKRVAHIPRLPTAIMFPDTPLLSSENSCDWLNCSPHCRSAHLPATGLNVGCGAGVRYNAMISNIFFRGQSRPIASQITLI